LNVNRREHKGKERGKEKDKYAGKELCEVKS
jgi:hypothetical protein